MVSQDGLVEGDKSAGLRVYLDKEQANLAQRDCRRPHWMADVRAGNVRRVVCGLATCSRECRDKWARKHALCAEFVFQDQPPTHHCGSPQTDQ